MKDDFDFKINEVLEYIRLYHYYSDICYDVKEDLVLTKKKPDLEYLNSLHKKQGEFVSVIMKNIYPSTYYLYHRLYDAMQKNDSSKVEEIKNVIKSHGRKNS